MTKRKEKNIRDLFLVVVVKELLGGGCGLDQSDLRVGHVITQTGTASDNGIGGGTTGEQGMMGNLPAEQRTQERAHRVQKIENEK